MISLLFFRPEFQMKVYSWRIPLSSENSNYVQKFLVFDREWITEEISNLTWFDQFEGQNQARTYLQPHYALGFLAICTYQLNNTKSKW